jgi:predicted transcriptional regulator
VKEARIPLPPPGEEMAEMANYSDPAQIYMWRVISDLRREASRAKDVSDELENLALKQENVLKKVDELLARLKRQAGRLEE